MQYAKQSDELSGKFMHFEILKTVFNFKNLSTASIAKVLN